MVTLVEPSYGTFDGCPARWTPYEAWVLYVRTWRKVHPAELLIAVRPTTKAEFERAFPRIPAMPNAAFQVDG